MIQQFDIAVFRFFNSLAGASLFGDAMIRFCAAYLLYVVIAGVLLFFASLLLPQFRTMRVQNIKAAIFIMYAAFFARIVIAESIRLLVPRARPFETLAGVRQLVAHSNGASFPSGNASLAFGIAAAVAYYYPKTSIAFFVAAVFIGTGRVAAGVHWPSDIVGGAIAGFIGAILARKAMAIYTIPPPPFFHGTEESKG